MLLAAGSAMHVSANTHAVLTVNAVKAQPENVTNLAAVTEKYIAVLSWTPVEGADSYWIYRNGEKVDIEVAGDQGQQTVSNLSPGTEYTFTVVTRKGGESSTGASVTVRTKEDAVAFDKGENIALGKQCKASSEVGNNFANSAVDGKLDTRWESKTEDPSWFYVDLGEVKPVKNITIRWETAYSKSYTISVSNDAQNWKEVYATKNGNGGAGNPEKKEDIYLDENARYVRFEGTERGTGYGHSFWEFEIYSKAPASQLTSLLLDPAKIELQRGDTQQFTVSALDQYGRKMTIDPKWSVIGGGSITDNGLYTASDVNDLIYVEVTDQITGTKGRAEVTVKPQVEFSLNYPATGDQLYETRRPTFKWDNLNGASKYEIYVNVTRDDYDWTAPGNLLDRYTKVGESNTNEFTMPYDLVDRWTYKWYVIAKDAAGNLHYSNTNVFALYIPEVTKYNDGIKIIDGCRDLNKNGKVDDYENWRLPIQKRIDDLFNQMTIEEKAWQMYYNAQNYPLAGWAFGPINEDSSARLQAASAQTRLGIPYVASGDCIHGYKTSYPVQSTLAATGDVNLGYRCGSIQRMEQVAVGFRGTLAPLAEVGTKAIYDRIQEGSGEDADFAAAMTKALVTGLQGGPELNPKSVMVHTKHWPGEGAGGEGGIVYDAVTINYHMKPWYANKEANAGAIMPGYAGSSFLDPGGPGAGDSAPILRYLRDVIGYDGLICTDWLPNSAWIDAANAGSDIMGGADPSQINMNDFINAVGEERINDAVKRILRAKFQLGIFEDPYGDPEGGQKYFHTAESHATVVEAARRAVTLLKNNNVLPIPAKLRSGDELLVTGPRADDKDAYCIWTSYFHPEYGAKTFYQGIKDRAELDGINVVTEPTGNTKLAVICVGETGFTHRTSWKNTEPYLHDAFLEKGGQDIDETLVRDIVENKHIPTILVWISPRPYVLGWTNDECDAIVMAGRPGDGAGEALASVLFGDYQPEGKLPWQLPRSMDQIGGEEQKDAKEEWDLPFDLGATDEERTIIRSLIAAGSHVEPIYGDPLYQFGAGMNSFGIKDDTAPTAFDLTAPANNSNVNTLPTLSWNASNDNESNIRYYEVYVDDQLVATTRSTSIKLESIKGNGTHNWYVLAENWGGKKTKSQSTFSFSINDNNAPKAFTLITPKNGDVVEGDALLVWESSYDDGTGIDTYDIYLNDRKAASVKGNATSVENENFAKGALVTTSSNNNDLTGAKAVDGDETTRWQANESDTNGDWIELELDGYYILNGVNLKWEAAYAKQYNIQTSLDGKQWETVYTENGSDGGTDEISGLNSTCHYVKINCTERGTGYGSSLFEIVLKGKNTVNTILHYPDGNYDWTVKAVDYAGNVTEASAKYNFTITGSTAASIKAVTEDANNGNITFDGKYIRLNDASANTKYEIYTLLGAKVKEGRGNIIRVNQPSGVYLVKAAGETLKFIVK